MTYVQIINIVCYVLCVVLFGVMLYFKIRGNAVGAVSELIAMAEETDLAGSEKMALVVSKLYERIPAAFKGFLTEEKLQEIAQWVFDWMRKYALAYIDGHEEHPEEPDMTGIEDTNHELLEDMINRLSTLSIGALKEMAGKLGIDISCMNDEEILKAIILACLIKN